MNQYGVMPMSDVFLGLVPLFVGVAVVAGLWMYFCRRLVGPGLAADRLWFRSITAVMLAIALYMGAYWVGVTPASQGEREFIALVIRAADDAPAIRSQAKALDAVMKSDYYVSRQHFKIAERISEQL